MNDGDNQRLAHVRSRPIRVAFLIDHQETSQPILDAIFECSFSFWGGRFSLVIPCEEGAVRPSFFPWLRDYDADVIYSYVELNEVEQLRLHEELCPSYLIHHNPARGADPADSGTWRPKLPFAPLGTATLLPMLARRSIFGPPQKLRLVTAIGRFPHLAFLRDSFGTHDWAVERRVSSQLSDEVELVGAIGDGVDISGYRHIGETVARIEELLALLSARRNVVTYAQLSAVLTPRPDIRDWSWSHSFNLVVGDTVTDRLLYWNGRSLYPVWRDGDPVDLRVPYELVAQEEFCRALASYLRGIPPISGDNSGGPPYVTLRSTSVPKADLEKIRVQLDMPKSWVTYSCDFVPSIDAVVPKRFEHNGLEHELSQVGGLPTGRWFERIVAAGRWHLSSEPPEHLRHAPASFQSEGEGLWAVDLDVERGNDNSPYSNVRDRWRLPRRLRVTRSFISPYRLSNPHGGPMYPRVSKYGALTLFSGGAGGLPTIREPTDHEAVAAGLTQGRDWAPIKYGATHPAQLCFAAERSDAGRYFWGAYQLLGDLNAASSFLLHSFWRRQLAKFGATDQRPEQRLESVRSRLRKKAAGKPLDLSDRPSLDRLADLVLQEADAIRLSIQSISWTDLRADHDRFVQAHEEAVPGDDEQVEEYREWERRSLVTAVQSLCEQGVLHQGLEHHCPRCHHTSWIAISNLRPSIACEVCKHPESAPVDRAWAFRLNDFLREALRRHGVGPLFWALNRLRPMGCVSYWFEGPLGIFFSKESYEARKRDTDIDLTVVADGRVRMCEVKQSVRGFDDPDRYAAQFRRLRPDVATIAIMEEPSPRIQATFKKFEAGLAGTGIVAELITLDPKRDIEDRAYLG